MDLIALFLIVAFTTNVATADIVKKARGAAARKHFSTSSQIDIDDIIRAEDDPDFLQYLKDRERQKKLDKAVELSCEKQHHAEAAAYEKARVQFVNEERKKVVPTEAGQEEQYNREQLAWERQQEKDRQEYVKAHQKREEKIKLERMARIQKALSLQRLPASDK